jgi:hypothetical protein
MLAAWAGAWAAPSLYLATLKPRSVRRDYYGVLPGVQPDFSKIQAAVLDTTRKRRLASPAPRVSWR